MVYLFINFDLNILRLKNAQFECWSAIVLPGEPVHKKTTQDDT